MRISVLDVPPAPAARSQENEAFTAQQFLAFFARAHHKKLGSAVSFTRGKDHKLARQLTESIPEKVLKQMVVNFFAFGRTRYSLGAFWTDRDLLEADAVEEWKQRT